MYTPTSKTHATGSAKVEPPILRGTEAPERRPSPPRIRPRVHAERRGCSPHRDDMTAVTEDHSVFIRDGKVQGISETGVP